MVILQRLPPQDDDKLPGARADQAPARGAKATDAPPHRPSSRSIPPPIPTGPRRQRPATTRPDSALLSRPRPDSPSVVESAITHRPTPTARAAQLAETLASTETADPRGAAIIAYELGELYERTIGDEQQALAQYRRGFALDPTFSPSSWSLRRLLYHRKRWTDLAKLIEVEVGHATEQRADLQYELALVLDASGVRDGSRQALERCLELAPGHLGALFAYERQLVRANDAAVVDVWERLANVVARPEHKVAYWLEVAHKAAASDASRAGKAVEAADALSVALGDDVRWPLARRVALARLRVADLGGQSNAIAAALEALAQSSIGAATRMRDARPARAVARRREMVALRHRQAHLARAEHPERSWGYLQQAYALAPDEPVVIVDLLEVASELGHYAEIPALIEAWCAVEDDAGREAMVSWWCAKAHTDRDKKQAIRGLLAALESTTSFVLLTSTIECEALADPRRVRAQLDLANAYLGAAKAAAHGTWLGVQRATQPDHRTAGAFYLQAAHLLVHHVATPAAYDTARDVLATALEGSPGDPATLEELNELDVKTGRIDQAVARIIASGESAAIERAIRVGYQLGSPESVIELLRKLDQPAHRWQLVAALAEAGRDDDCLAPLLELSVQDTDPDRRCTALLELARARGRDDPAGAIDAYRKLLAERPTFEVARDELVDLLRAQRMWPELVEARCVEARAATEPPAIRRALREAAWVREVCIDDLAGAAALYAEWLARVPDDRTALEGLARCRAALRDHAGEIEPRRAILAADGSVEAAWLYAASLERAGRYADAAAQYRDVAANEEASVAAISATLALGDLAARVGDVSMRVDAADALALRTSDPRLGAALAEESGWTSIISLRDLDRAARSFASALELQPDRQGALLGTALVAAYRSEREVSAAAQVQLASTVEAPELVGGLLLRAAATAAAAGNTEEAAKRVRAALEAAPDDPGVITVAAETALPNDGDTRDPFAVSERLVAHADLLARRAALSDDRATRSSWALERAETLEQGGELFDAAAVIGEVLADAPYDHHALALLRRIAQQMGNQLIWASTTYALAQTTSDRPARLRLLRDAASVYDGRGPLKNSGYALAIYRQIVEVDATAPELDRLLGLLRERNDASQLLMVITLVLGRSVDAERKIELLLERASWLSAIRRDDLAIADIKAVLEFAPDHPVARERAASYADVEPTSRRPADEHLLAKIPVAQEELEITRVQPVEPTWDSRTKADIPSAIASTSELLSEHTPVADMSALVDQEYEVAKSRPNAAPPAERAIRIPPLDLAALVEVSARAFVGPELDLAALAPPEQRDLSIGDSDVVMLSYDELAPPRTDGAATDALEECERELATEKGATVVLHLEAGRLCETLASAKRAREHYEAALASDPRAVAAIRGLRRIAVATGDLTEATRLIEAELVLAGPRERGPLRRYRLDMLMAAGEHDVARVAVGEILDDAPHDLPALLVQLELALLDDRADEFGSALERIAVVVTDPGLRAAVQSVRSILWARDGNHAEAARWMSAAGETVPGSLAAQLGTLRDAAAQGQGETASAALFDLACQVEADDPVTAAALAMRAQLWATGRETLEEVVQLASRIAPRDVLVARITSEVARTVSAERSVASHAFTRWARCKAAPAERAYAAARAAELEPERLGRLWAQVLELDPGDDYAEAKLRAVYVASGELELAIDLDQARAASTHREAPAIRAAAELDGTGKRDAAIAVLERAIAARPASAAACKALAATLARAGRWLERAQLLTDFAARPEVMARDVARLRSALAWDTAVRHAGAGVQERTIVSALNSWDLVLADNPRVAVAHGAAIALATRLADHGILLEVLGRAQLAEPLPAASASLALRRARLLFRTDPRLAQELARDAAPESGDPRCTLVVMLAAALRGELGEVATALEERATKLDPKRDAAAVATLRLRAAQLLLDAGDRTRAQALLARVDETFPGMVDDLLEVVQPENRQPRATSPRSFTRALRAAERALTRGQPAAALAMYKRALAFRPTDPLAAGPLVRLAVQLRDPVPITSLTNDQLRAAEAMDDPEAVADAHELVATVEKDLRRNDTSAIAALTSAYAADPSRLELAHRLECELVRAGRHADVLRVREGMLESITGADAVPTIMDVATLAVRERAPDEKLAALYRAALRGDPDHRLALVHLEAILRRTREFQELAELEERVAASAEPVTAAAHWTLAGQAYALLGNPIEAVRRFARAVEVSPTYTAALDAWYEIALEHELWVDLAACANLKALRAATTADAATWHHFAGVVLMDKVRAREPAIEALQRALDADPSHGDAFARLWLLLDAPTGGDALATLLRRRLTIDHAAAPRIELHFALAEHLRAGGDRDGALAEYRAVLGIDPARGRAHAAIADLASEHGEWQSAAAAVLARVPLEVDPRVLKTLHYRLGVLYSDRDDAKALAAFQRALSYGGNDTDTLVRVASLAIRAKDWDLALDACNQLVTTERDPEKLATHFQLAATVLEDGLGELERAGRMLALGLESSPTNPDGLRRVVEYFERTSDPAGLRASTEKLCELMRARVANDVYDGAAYRTLAAALAARGKGASPSARAAAELADLLGAATESERAMLAQPPRPETEALVGRSADERLFAGAAQPGLRRLFQVLNPAIVKHVGIELGAYGVRRKDRLHAGAPIVAIVGEVAGLFGQREIDVYVSTHRSHLMVAEPTQPVSLVVGDAIANGDPGELRFAAGGAIGLAHMSLAIPARLPPDELGLLVLAMLRLFRTDARISGVDIEQLEAQLAKLRRAVPASLLEEARPHVLEADDINLHAFVRDLKIAGLRAGWAASGSLVPGLRILAASLGTDPVHVLGDPIVRSLVSFALSEV